MSRYGSLAKFRGNLTGTYLNYTKAGIDVLDEGTVQGVAESFDFVGGRVAAADSGDTIDIVVTGNVVGTMTVQEEGVTVGTAAGITTIDFVGAPVTAVGAANVTTVTVVDAPADVSVLQQGAPFSSDQTSLNFADPSGVTVVASPAGTAQVTLFDPMPTVNFGFDTSANTATNTVNLGNGSSTLGSSDSTVVGIGSTSAGIENLIVGHGADTLANNNCVLLGGNTNRATGDDCVNMAWAQLLAPAQSTILGADQNTVGAGAVSFSIAPAVHGANSVSIARQASTGADTTVIGSANDPLTVIQTGGIVFADSYYFTGTDACTLGPGSNSAGAESIVLGPSGVCFTADCVSLGFQATTNTYASGSSGLSLRVAAANTVAGAAPGPSTHHIIVTINGTRYRINCETI